MKASSLEGSSKTVSLKVDLINEEPLALSQFYNAFGHICLSQFWFSYKARFWVALQTQAATKTCIISIILLPPLSPVSTATGTMTTTTTTTNVPTATGSSAVPTTALDSIGQWQPTKSSGSTATIIRSVRSNVISADCYYRRGKSWSTSAVVNSTGKPKQYYRRGKFWAV